MDCVLIMISMKIMKNCENSENCEKLEKFAGRCPAHDQPVVSTLF